MYFEKLYLFFVLIQEPISYKAKEKSGPNLNAPYDANLVTETPQHFLTFTGTLNSNPEAFSAVAEQVQRC